MTAPSPADLDRFYVAIERVAEFRGRLALAEAILSASVPVRGVYFVFDVGEHRTTSHGLRVVRVGTHGLARGSRSTLRGRLRQHCGSRTGFGNHRASVFRSHVGAALLHRGGHDLPSWGVRGAEARRQRASEREHERLVSRYMRELLVVTLEVADDPGPANRRGFIERNSIALLASVGSRVDPPSAEWLGWSSTREAVRSSGLWNVRHGSDTVDPSFLAVLETMVFGA